MDLPAYVDGNRLWGRYGFAGLHWTCRELCRGVRLAGGDVLDVGAGTGLLSMCLLHMGARSVVALEPAAAGAATGVAREAAAHARTLGLAPPRWVYLDRTFQSYQPDRRFRLIFSRASINHLDEPSCERILTSEQARGSYRDIFARMRALLEPDGRIVVSDCGPDNFWRRMGLASPFAPEIEWHKHQEPRTWSSLMAEAGLETTAVRWHNHFYRARHLGPLLHNRPLAWMVGSVFILTARPAPGPGAGAVVGATSRGPETAAEEGSQSSTRWRPRPAPPPGAYR